MTRRMLVALPLLCADLLPAQEDPENKTEGLRNGRWWKEQQFTAKLYYLLGIMDGAGYVLAKPNFKTRDFSIAESLRIFNVKYEELIAEIDKFYSSEILNARIPVTAVLTFINKKATGTPEVGLQNYIAELRRRWNQ